MIVSRSRPDVAELLLDPCEKIIVIVGAECFGIVRLELGEQGHYGEIIPVGIEGQDLLVKFVGRLPHCRGGEKKRDQ